VAVICKSSAELDKMHRAGLVVWRVLNELKQIVRPGMTTMDLEKYAERRVAEQGGRAAFKGYRGYPCVLCTSINEEVVHGIPSGKRRIEEGDILSLDFGVEMEGYYGDAAVTIPVGKIAPEAERLLRVTRESLDRAIEQARPGNRLSDISHAVQSWVEGNGFSVVRELVGHGIPAIRILEDEWTAVTADGSLSAHFEHTVAITSDGPWILTRPREEEGPSW
jgi:methionyl aminopeptidase